MQAEYHPTPEAIEIVHQSAEVSDDLLLLSEHEAVTSLFDGVNHRRLSFMLWFFVAVAAVYQLVFVGSGSVWRGALAGLVVLIDLLILRVRNRPGVTRIIRQVCAGVVVGHFLVLQAFHLGLDATGPGLWYLVMLMFVSRLRLAMGEAIALLGSLFAVLAARLVVVDSVLLKEGFPVSELVGFFVVLAVALAVSTGVSLRTRKRFLLRWRAEAVRQRDRLRMKQELEYARQIQLSMLPREAPVVRGLDIAALSLPATEVGGDYYDYFTLDGGRLAVVVGDVTGHGVASGLVLSGVRSSLNLLEEEMGSPRLILDRVNRMLKKISTPRMLMTLGIAVLDHDGRAVTVATAAHPPVIKVSVKDGRVVEIGRGSLPLGAMASTEYMEDRVPLDPGDTLLLYSDGLVEAADAEGEQYGWSRLHSVLREAADESSARGARDRILRDVWEFKGDTEQLDDITMVVIRIVEE